MNRLDFIASLAKNENTILDIGTDHAYTVINAILKYNVKYAIASDINIGPLKQAELNIKKYHLEDKIKLILSDGLDNINDDFDLAIISGMGGMVIINIIKAGLDKLKNKKLIISAHSDFYKLREYVTLNGFIIEDEYSLNDNNKYYEVMKVIPGKKEYLLNELKYGPILLKKKEDAFINHLKREKTNLAKALLNMSDNNISKHEIKNKIDEIDVILNGN